MNKQLTFDQITEIAKEVLPDFHSPKFPELEEIAWAFPIGTKRYTHRMINNQECEALAHLSIYQNFNLVLQFLLERKPSELFGELTIPNHTLPVGDVEDVAHQVAHYLPQCLEEKLNHTYEYWPEPVSAISPDRAPGFYWINLPKTLKENILNAGLTIEGNKINTQNEAEKIARYAYESENLTRDYVSFLRDSVIQGAQYLQKIAEDQKNKENSPLLVKVKSEDCSEGDYIELGIPSKNVVSRGNYVSPDESGSPAIQLWENQYESLRKIERSPRFSKDFPLWKLVSPELK
jgi:hypothetical protein